jgi:DNA repair photolyase
MKITDTKPGKVVVKTGFRWYDYCINGYVGCGHGCRYCYVQFLVKDELPWGDFLRVRAHIEKQLIKELKVLNGKRVVIGTVTDPYQPAEAQYNITSTILRLLAQSGAIKVGVYTKSPLVARDMDLLLMCQNPNLHMTITPISEHLREKIEPGGTRPNMERFAVVKQFKAAGFKVRLNVAPLIPAMSAGLLEPIIKEIVACRVDQFYVDPMQPYKQAVASMEALNLGDVWVQAKDIMTDRSKYAAWKAEQREAWMTAWKKLGDSRIIAIWSDHENKVSEDLNNGEPIDPKKEIQ